MEGLRARERKAHRAAAEGAGAERRLALREFAGLRALLRGLKDEEVCARARELLAEQLCAEARELERQRCRRLRREGGGLAEAEAALKAWNEAAARLGLAPGAPDAGRSGAAAARPRGTGGRFGPGPASTRQVFKHIDTFDTRLIVKLLYAC